MSDEDLNLDDYDERPQPKPRLPDHRKESPAYEVGGPVHGAREEPVPPTLGSDLFESTTTVGAGGWEPATSEEIADYDLSGAGTGNAPVEQKPAAAPAPATKKGAEEVNDLEEFIARTAADTPAADKPARVRRPLSLVEKVCWGAGAAVLLMLGIWLMRAAVSSADAGPARSLPKPDLPMKGALITIPSAAGEWRKSVKDADRLEQIEVILPTPGHYEPGIIPELTFSIDSSASTNGYLRIIFRDSDNKPRGDTRVVQVTNGKLVDQPAVGAFKNGTDAAVYCSSGLFDESAFRAYANGDERRWSIEIAESTSYNSDDKDWKILGTFDVSNNLAQ